MTSTPAPVTVVTHPLVLHKLTLLRQRETSTSSFRSLLAEISMLMAYEVTRDLPLVYEQIQPEGGFHGVHFRIRVRDAAVLAEVTSSFTIDQTILIDQATSKVFLFVVGCSSECFDKHEGEIDRVVKSWTVKDK